MTGYRSWLSAALQIAFSMSLAAHRSTADEEWNVKPDPGPARKSFNLPDGFFLPFPGNEAKVGCRAVFPEFSRQHVLLVHNFSAGSIKVPYQLWDLSDRIQKGGMAGEIEHSTGCIINDNGTLAAVLTSKAVKVWSLEDESASWEISLEQSRPHWCFFVSNNGLLIVSHRNREVELMLHRLDPKNPARKRVDVASIEGFGFDRKSLCVSPGGRWLAGLQSIENRILVIDIESLSIAQGIPLGPHERPAWNSCEGTAFSPDGTELAGIISRKGVPSVVSWSLRDGKQIDEQPIRSNPTRRFLPWPERDLVWWPKGSYWWIRGQTLIDRKTGRELLTLEPPAGTYGVVAPAPWDESRVVYTTGVQRSQKMAIFKIPFPTVESLLEESKTGAAWIRPGCAVAVNVEMGQLHTGKKERIESELKETIQRNLEIAGHTIAENSDVRMKVRYEETAGAPISVTRPSPVLPLLLPFGGRRGTGAPRSEEGQGTGFVVTTEGHLVTCAHVVGTLEVVDVTLDGKKYVGEVLARDSELDLALVKVDGKNLPVVTVSSSNDVELGEDLRVFGFPLSDKLGESLKAARGALGGHIRKEKKELLQIDAAVNPGNSGGPVIDDRGNVIGVITQKLIGDSVDNVGIAVPSSALQAFLKNQKVKYRDGPATKKLDGPAIYKTISGSVALIRPRIVPATPEGKVVPTNMVVKVELLAKNLDGPLWSKELKSVWNPPRNETEARIRSSVNEPNHQAILEGLRALEVPAFISKRDPSRRLPLVVRLP